MTNPQLRLLADIVNLGHTLSTLRDGTTHLISPFGESRLVHQGTIRSLEANGYLSMNKPTLKAIDVVNGERGGCYGV